MLVRRIKEPSQARTVLLVAALVLCLLLGLAAAADDGATDAAAGSAASAQEPEAELEPSPAPSSTESPAAPEPMPQPMPQPKPEPTPAALPDGTRQVFARGRTLVAYYGTAGTGALGVLGETPPDTMVRRLRRAAAPFQGPHGSVQLVFELIVTVADPFPGPGGDYNHEIARADVRRYIAAAHRHDALLLLDLQPGRTGFLDVARRWAWALRDPYVGLALDPEWRMDRHGVPGRRIGSVSAQEVGRVSAWLSGVVARNDLPRKLFVLHQFRRDMIRDSGSIERRPGLVMVQHVDGFGTQGQKLDTYHHVARPGRFVMGLKLFYDEDVNRFTAREVRAIRPNVRFVSFQ